MQFGLNWLADWVDKLPATDKLVEKLPQYGFEIASQACAGIGFSDVVTAEIQSTEQHPNADKLKVCKVFDASGVRQIVCGAPNARAGIKVALAKVGALLPDDFEIKVSTIRGVESSGMLCSQRELKLGEDHDGIIELPADTPLGQDYSSLLQLNEEIIEVEITPNRGDCLSLLGMAREVAAMFELKLKMPDKPHLSTSLDISRQVFIDQPKACPAYFARIVRLAQPPGSSPEWMQRRLERAGLRTINLWIDITNYVALELGQPLHAFDNKKLKGNIQVRYARDGETLKLINEQEVNLLSHHLLITDESGPVALGGVMGGDNTAVDDTTLEVLIEAAHFTPDAVAGRARELKLTSDACFRFERGVDPNLPAQALDRVCSLLVEIADAELAEQVGVVEQQHLPSPKPIKVSIARLSKLAGVQLQADFVTQTLQSLGFSIKKTDQDSLLVTPPTYRLDVELEQDILEEVLRFYGFSNLPDVLPLVAPSISFDGECRPEQARLEDHLVALGYQETINYSFISQDESDSYYCGVAIELANSIAENYSVMRPTMLPSLVQVLDRNRRHQQRDIRVFETGLVYCRVEGVIEQTAMLGLAAAGNTKAIHWRSASQSTDFYGLKGDIESICGLFGFADALSWQPLVDHPGLHPGRSASLLRNAKQIGIIGELHPALCKKYDFAKTLCPVVAEIQLESLLEKPLAHFGGVSRFPGTSRDFSFVLDSKYSYAEIEQIIRKAAGPFAREVLPFDVFSNSSDGANAATIPAGHHSLSVRVHWINSKDTLTDSQINHFSRLVVKTMETNFAATQR